MTTIEKQTLAKQRIENFFDNEIALFVLPDIRRLDSIRPDHQGLQGCTVPHAMLLFSLVDLFGFLLRDEPNPKKTETQKNFNSLLNDGAYFPNIYAQKSEMLCRLFRHGLIHQFFPKASGISKAGLSHPLIFQDGTTPILNVDVFSRDMVAAIAAIRKAVVAQDILFCRMNDRLDLLAADDYKELAKH